MAKNTQVLSTSLSFILDRSIIYPEHYTCSYAYPSIPSSSSIALLIEAIQPLAKDLEELKKDFFYKGQYIVNKHTYKNIKNNNIDISSLY